MTAKPRSRKTARRVGTRGKSVALYLTEAALRDWESIPEGERAKVCQDALHEYAQNPTRQKADK